MIPAGEDGARDVALTGKEVAVKRLSLAWLVLSVVLGFTAVGLSANSEVRVTYVGNVGFLVTRKPGRQPPFR